MARTRDTLSGAKHCRKSPRLGGLFVWAGMATNGRTYLYVFAGDSVTAVRYRDEIIHPLVRSFIAALGTDAVFMDDNARPHRARFVRSFVRVKPFHRWRGLLDNRT
ncbi:hypothetical protein AVEN_167519-1 [Araneus ventricosus]|uniref:Tc1-like transposase DDE domain-containing protein n=1 Tax=Araneus ventricosus TaxID=182803 RepID=A0A4Y2V3U5_ARAVE|nr:hypothetical protein AVEN_167519-1 [Araneus ventricosus]